LALLLTKEHASYLMLSGDIPSSLPRAIVKHYIRSLSPRFEFAIVVIGAFGLFAARSLAMVFDASGPTPISDSGLLSIIVHEVVVAAALLTFLKIRQWTLGGLGVAPSLRETLVGIGLAVAAYTAYVVVVLTAVGLSPYVSHVAANPIFSSSGLSLVMIVAVSIVNSIYEELFVAGYVISALKERRSMWTAINVSIAIRLSYHLYQGPIGVLSVIPLGFIFAYWYARTGRLWPLIVAHALSDLLGLLAAS